MKKIASKILAANVPQVILPRFINNNMIPKSREMPIRNRKQLSVISGQRTEDGGIED